MSMPNPFKWPEPSDVNPEWLQLFADDYATGVQSIMDFQNDLAPDDARHTMYFWDTNLSQNVSWQFTNTGWYCNTQQLFDNSGSFLGNWGSDLFPVHNPIIKFTSEFLLSDEDTGDVIRFTGGNFEIGSNAWSLHEDGSFNLASGSAAVNSDGSAAFCQGNVAFDLDGSGHFGNGTVNLTADGGVHSTFTDTQRLAVTSPTVPMNAAASGTAGDISWDADHFYVCVANNEWKRTDLATWV